VVWGKRTLWMPFTPAQCLLSSVRRELEAMLLCLRAAGPLMGGATLAMLSDSVGAVMALNKGRLKGKGMKHKKQRAAAKAVLEECYALMRLHSIHAVAVYLPREFLREADAVSKQVDAASYTLWAATSGYQPL
jgi:hypothetical protein